MVEKDKISSEIKTKLEGAQERLQLNTHLRCGRKSQKPRQWKWDQKIIKKGWKEIDWWPDIHVIGVSEKDN